MCIDGKNIITDTGNRINIDDTDDTLALLPPRDANNTFDRLDFEFWLWAGSLALCGTIMSAGTLHTARHSLKHGNQAAVTAEKMSYEERLLAVSTLSLVRALAFFLTAWRCCLEFFNLGTNRCRPLQL